MKRSPFTEEQIIGILKAQWELSVPELCRKHSISDATLYNWRPKFVSVEMFDTRKPKAPEEENWEPEQLLAAPKECRVRAIAERSYARRRACGLVGPHPKTHRDVSKWSDDDASLALLWELAALRRRFGFWWLYIRIQ